MEILTHHLLRTLAQAKAKSPIHFPVVMPAQTDIGGRSIGFAKALRQLNEEIDASSEAIRPRLHRARLRLLVKRPGVMDDLAVVHRLDADSVEA